MRSCDKLQFFDSLKVSARMRMFLTPRDLKAQLEQAAATLAPGHFIRKPENQHLKDIWSAAHFGLGYQRHVRPCALWVNPEQNSDTDFVLKTENGEFSFQTTLSDVPERRMSDDHRPGPDGRFPGRPYHPDRGTHEGPGWIADAVRKKLDVKYSAARDLNLLVYANFPTNGLDHESVRDAATEFAGQFASIWVITNNLVCSLMSFPALGEIPGLRMIYDEQELSAL
jgi:hypothetical protein